MKMTNEIQDRRKKLRTLAGAILCTILWIVLFPILAFAAMLSGIVFSSHISAWMGYSIVILAFLMPLSSLATIFCIWICYFYKNISLMYSCNIISIGTIIALGFLVALLANFALILH